MNTQVSTLIATDAGAPPCALGVSFVVNGIFGWIGALVAGLRNIVSIRGDAVSAALRSPLTVAAESRMTEISRLEGRYSGAAWVNFGAGAGSAAGSNFAGLHDVCADFDAFMAR